MDKTDIEIKQPEENSDPKNESSWLGWIIMIVSIFVLFYDFFIIPWRRGTYLTDCVIVNSMVINMSVANANIREVFYDCNGKRTSPELIQQCWKAIIPETYSYASGVINKCLSAPGYPQKLLFD